MNNQIAAIIVAAGQATRYGSPKVLESLAGVPVVVRSVSAFLLVESIGDIVVVSRSDLIPLVDRALKQMASGKDIRIVAGGDRRQDSVSAGLAAVPEAGVVVVHDGARPLVSPQIIRSTIDAVIAGADSAIAAVPVTDTLKRQYGDKVETVDRSNMWRAQTPQAFRADTLRVALARAETEGIAVTDESALIEQFGGKVILVEGDERNLKLTVPNDRAILEALVSMQSPQTQTRNGIGYDVHRLVEGRPLILGGVTIPFERGLDGHSDADVVLHAMCDAILGACALGDIGMHFPPGDSRFKGISSLVLLSRVIALVASDGYSVVNVDAMVIAEAPKIGPYVESMRSAISTASGLPAGAISIKATTNEGLGFAGRQEGIAAMATATIARLQ